MTLPNADTHPQGAVAEMKRDFVLTQDDFNRFADLSGDHNPIHVDPEYSAATRFGATVSHGMLLFTVLRGLVQAHYPGARLESQDLKFPAPAYTGERLTATLVPGAPAVDGCIELVTRITRGEEKVCLEGRCRLVLSEEVRP
ncbi:MaoC/PaaZ C-terminal domain-containing protein [Microbulbifer sediminum]|uniref:MaoC/PaaZ C-terminal domain-containing protein n=1 Tax=Microbulbifer sediminum TaxID=2904250 RepID=UPI001F2602A1|nr:MaoC/PaaZ C-terminal domain-containing protein [Microbulbifer sediminum]